MPITAGKHKAKVESHGVRENARLENQPLEAYATFTVDGQKLYWNGLLLTREGGRNSKTMKCLAAMGLEAEDVVGWMGLNLDNHEVQLTVVETTKKNGEPVMVVDWVNSVGGQTQQGDVIEKLKAAGLAKDEFGF